MFARVLQGRKILIPGDANEDSNEARVIGPVPLLESVAVERHFQALIEHGHLQPMRLAW